MNPRAKALFERGWQRVRRNPPSFVSVVAGLLFSVVFIIGFLFAKYYQDVPRAIGFDDGHAAAFGERLLDGHMLPFVDAVCHRGPLLYWMTAIFEAIAGRMEWTGLRMLWSFVFLVALASCYGIGVAVRRPLAGALAAAVYLYIMCFALPTGSSLGVHGEPVASAFVTLAMAVCAWGLHREGSIRKRIILLFVSGALMSLGGLVKQTMLPAMGPQVVWAAAVLFADEGLSTRDRLKTLAWMVAGWFAPLLLVVAFYAAHGALRTFWYYSFTYNSQVYMGPYKDAKFAKAFYDWVRDNPYIALSFVLVLLRPAAKAVSTLAGIPKRVEVARNYASNGLEITVGLQLFLVLSAAFAALRFWAHYFIPAIPWIAVLIGWTADEAIQRNEKWRLRLAQLGAAAGMLAFLIPIANHHMVGLYKNRKEGRWVPMRPDPMCEVIDKYSRPDQKIFIWGFDSDLYITCKRKAASRYMSLTTVAGIVPPFWGQPSPKWVVPGSRDILASELETNRPALVLDIPERLEGYSIRSVPEAMAVLNRLYCPTGPITKGNRGKGVSGWILRQGDTCPQL